MSHLQTDTEAKAQKDLIFNDDRAAVMKLERAGGYFLAAAIILAAIGAYILITTFLYGGRSSLLMEAVGAGMLYPMAQYVKFRKLLTRLKSDAQPATLARARKHLRRGFLFAGTLAGLVFLILIGGVILIISLGDFHR